MAQRIFKYSDTQYVNVTLDKKTEQFDIAYRTLFYVNIYGSYKRWKQSGVLAHPVQYLCWRFLTDYYEVDVLRDSNGWWGYQAVTVWLD